MTASPYGDDWQGRGRYEALEDLPELHRSDPPKHSLYTKAHRAPYTVSPRSSIPDPSAPDGDEGPAAAEDGPQEKGRAESQAGEAGDAPDLRHVRRYSRQWVALSWADQVKRRGRWPRVVYTAAGVVVIVLWVIVVLVFARQETKIQRKNLTQDSARLRPLALGALDYRLTLKGTLRGFDVDARVLKIQWSSVYLNPDGNTFHDMGTDDMNTFEINIYRDLKALPDPEVTEYFADETTYYRLDNTSAYRIATVGLHPWDSFDTNIDMSQAVDNDVWKQPMFGYPWDVWSGSLVIVSTLADFDRIYNTTGYGVFSFNAITMEGSILQVVYIDIKASRSAIVIFCVIVVVVVNWICTLAIFLVTGEVILLRRRHILQGMDMLSVCFAALFALPTVRSLLPGAPQDFGAVIDFVGILPNVIIISLCTTVFACAKLRSRLKHTLSATQ
ncbi:hypothetical protein HDZ31DRAFT_61420 [Schizophyllum fasciatum]